MEEMYGLMNHNQASSAADASRESYQRHHAFDDQSPEFRHKRSVPAVFVSGSSNVRTGGSDYNHNNNGLTSEELEDDISSANRDKIISHPLYPRLLEAYIACQKVGAPPDIANLFDEIFRDNDFCRSSSACSACLGDDPELDEFMETYCEMLDKYRSDLAKPFDEATTFLNNMQTQLTNLCKGASVTYNSGSEGGDGGCGGGFYASRSLMVYGGGGTAAEVKQAPDPVVLLGGCYKKKRN